ncbi:MAG: type II secretion system protein [Candidatus Omnitrophota bacterium]
MAIFFERTCGIKRVFDKKGMTLVEALVSILILVVVITSMMGAFIVGNMEIKRTKNRAKAMNLLQDRMEWVKSQSPFVIAGWISVPLPAENDVDSAFGGDDLVNDTRTTTVTQDSDGNLIVTVCLNWEKAAWGTTMTKGTVGDPDLELVTLISYK